jgi:two-component system NtrC family sensor kinase
VQNPATIRLSFQAKVLIPVLAFLILVPVVTSWIVHRRVSAQFEHDSNRKLQTAEKIFESSRAIRTQFLIARYRNFVQEPRFKAYAKLFENSENRESAAATLKGFFNGLLESDIDASGVNEAKILMFTTAEGDSISASGDPKYRTTELIFRRAAAELVTRTLESDISSDVVIAGEHLLNAVAVPVKVNGMLVGVLTVGIPIDASTAAEFASQTGSEIALVAADKIIATTLPSREAQQALAPMLSQMDSVEPKKISVQDEHYRALSVSFPALPSGQRFGYFLLASYEQSHRELLQTQATLWLISIGGIVISGCLVWLVIGRVTEPLRRLRDTAESVGRGDFSKRLEVHSNDELGALGHTFNQMTSNLQTSRAELEKTFETLKSTQNQLIQREKLSAVGEFVAGVAHELNNPLTSLIGFAELLKSSGVTQEQTAHLNFIVKSSQRCHKIVHSLLSFARQHAPERKIVNVGELLDSVLELLAYEMRTSNIEVITRYDSSLPRIIGDSHQLQQVILNILNNARQAIQAHQPTGQIRLVTERAAHLVRVTISDNGPGISRENLSKIFDPFFTTKPVGQGTGLGLSLCYGIIKEHGGSLHADSKPGAGATFTIEFPAASASAIASLRGSDSEPIANAVLPGKRILIIDDEEWILTLTRKVLEEDGYAVDVATDGQAALEAITDKKYDLLVCDQKMPGLSGPQLYERLTESHPEAAERLIFMTGDTVGDNFQQFLARTQKHCLTKPFSLVELRRTVANAVNNSPDPLS